MKPVEDAHPSLFELEAHSGRGDAQAQYLLGKRYYEGDGVETDLSKAVSLLRASAEIGNAAAQYAYGYICCFRIGVPEDKISAIR